MFDDDTKYFLTRLESLILPSPQKKKTFYTTNELSTPTTNTKRSHKPRPEKTVVLFSVQPFGEAKTTGTPTTNKNERAINAKTVSWKIKVINLRFNEIQNKCKHSHGSDAPVQRQHTSAVYVLAYMSHKKTWCLDPSPSLIEDDHHECGRQTIKHDERACFNKTYPSFLEDTVELVDIKSDNHGF